jgi:hypothetical protein
MAILPPTGIREQSEQGRPREVKILTGRKRDRQMMEISGRGLSAKLGIIERLDPHSPSTLLASTCVFGYLPQRLWG